MQAPVVATDQLREDMLQATARTATPVLVMGGVSYRTAHVDVREKLSVSETDLPGILSRLSAHPSVDEVLVLSTCNRTEVYLAGQPHPDWSELMRDILSEHRDATCEELQECMYWHEGERAARHLFRVAAGLDSMVLGEAEIVHQIKRSTQAARDAGTAGTVLQRLAEKALAASKRARTQVRYDECGLSVASIAVTACKRFYTELHDVSVLVLGAGETAELTLHYLVSKGVRKVMVANRTFSRAQQLARLTKGEALTLDEFPTRLADADVVICCTSSPTPLITAEMVASVMAAHPGKRLLVVDLAVPRDVEPEVAAVPGVRLLNVDNLQGTAEEISHQRQCKIQQAENIVEDEAREFGKWLTSRRTVAVMKALQGRIESVRASVAAQLADELHLTAAEVAHIVEPHTRELVEGVLREAIYAMQCVTGADDNSHQLEMARRLMDAFNWEAPVCHETDAQHN